MPQKKAKIAPDISINYRSANRLETFVRLYIMILVAISLVLVLNKP